MPNLYLATQVDVYRHLLTRHAHDPAFRFSLRKIFSKKPSPKEGLFIGTASSAYFAFTLWHIPLGFPGVRKDLITYVVRINKNGTFGLKLELVIPREGPLAGETGWNPNTEPSRELVENMPYRNWPAGVHWQVTPPDTQMLQLTYQVANHLPDVEALLAALDKALDLTATELDEAVNAYAENTPGWIGHGFTEDQFAQMRQRAELRCAALLAGNFPDEEPPSPEPTYWCAQVAGDPLAWSSFRQHHEVRPLFGQLLAGASNGSGDGTKLLPQAKPGDVVVVTQGPRRALGVGVLTGYFTADERQPPHTCPVEWLLTTAVELEGTPFVTGSMVWNQTHQWEAIQAAYAVAAPTALAALEARLTGTSPPEEEEDDDEPYEATPAAYWWLNINPKFWKVTDFEIGQEQTYTSHNENGHKRNVYANFQQVQSGDLVIGYETTPTKRVRAILEITKELHTPDEGEELITLRVKEFVREELPLKQLQDMVELASAAPLKGSQGSLYKLTPAEFAAIEKRAQRIEAPPLPPYALADAEQELFLTTTEIQHLQTALKRKKNLIVQGPPGVGKTYVARRLAWLQMGEKDDSRVQLVQFHQSYSYEDFIRGWRPTAGGAFELANGVFVDFVRRAQHDQAHDYFFLIDEINRGNLSKIFGELLLLLESDKRDPQYALPLTYRKPEEAPFYVPPNLFVIGTMNTADRSLALVDYALRRRFTFVDLVPHLDGKLVAHLAQAGVPTAFATSLLERVRKLNQQLVKDRNLGAGFQIGHSYFCVPLAGEAPETWWQAVVAHDLAPLLREYWFDDPDGKKAAAAVAALLDQNPAA